MNLPKNYYEEFGIVNIFQFLIYFKQQLALTNLKQICISIKKQVITSWPRQICRGSIFSQLCRAQFHNQMGIPHTFISYLDNFVSAPCSGLSKPKCCVEAHSHLGTRILSFQFTLSVAGKKHSKNICLNAYNLQSIQLRCDQTEDLQETVTDFLRNQREVKLFRSHKRCHRREMHLPFKTIANIITNMKPFNLLNFTLCVFCMQGNIEKKTRIFS